MLIVIVLGGLMNKGKALRSGNEDRGKIKVVCIPLFSILLALGNPVVDYFSLDTEGADFEIVKVILFPSLIIYTFLQD